jgi:tripeptidyl-peptidase-1
VAELVAPHQDTHELVHSWLEQHGVPSSSISKSHGGGWLTVTGVPVSQADDLLCASYQLYRHTGTNSTILRTVGYGLPAALHAHVQTVAPTTYFGSPRTPLRTPRKRSSEEAAVMVNVTSGELVSALSRRDGEVTPSILRKLYKTGTYVPSAMDQNLLGILGFNNEYPNQDDLTAFMTDFRTDAVDATFTVEKVNGGGYDQSHPGHEANMDTQYGAAMAYPTPQIFYSTGGKLHSIAHGNPAHDAFLEWFKYLLNLSKIPPTISISYGNIEKDYPDDYMKKVCDLFSVLAALGVSVLAGSGDDGVGLGDCLDTSKKDQFTPMFPASCACDHRSTQAQEAAHQHVAVLQVPGSPVLAARWPAAPRSRCPNPGAASHSTFGARTTRPPWCPPSLIASATTMKASTSEFTVAF